MKVHLVFPNEMITGIQEELEVEGFSVVDKDYSLDTFAQWAESSEEMKADVALIHGIAVVSRHNESKNFNQKRAIYERIREARLARPELKMIILFPKSVESEKDFISSIVQMGIYDLYFQDDISILDVIRWLGDTKSLADVEGLISGYQPKTNDEIVDSNTYSSKEPESVTNEEDDADVNNRRQRRRSEKAERKGFRIPRFNVGLPTSRRRDTQKEQQKGESFADRLSSFIPRKRVETLHPKLIVVGSLHRGAGSSFLIHNFTRYLANKNLTCGVLECSDQAPIWLELVRRELGSVRSDWTSWVSRVNNDQSLTINSRIENNGTHIFPISPKESLNNITTEIASEMIQIAKQIPLLFIDISGDWDNPMAQAAIRQCDECWIVLQPDPSHFSSQRAHPKKQVFINSVIQNIGDENCAFIGNMWGRGVDLDELPIDPFVKIPYLESNVSALMAGKPLYSMKPRSFGMFDKLGSRIVNTNLLRAKNNTF